MNTRTKACRVVCPDMSNRDRQNCRIQFREDEWTCHKMENQEKIEERKRLERKGGRDEIYL